MMTPIKILNIFIHEGGGGVKRNIAMLVLSQFYLKVNFLDSLIDPLPTCIIFMLINMWEKFD
jgi:hypothetical protein